MKKLSNLTFSREEVLQVFHIDILTRQVRALGHYPCHQQQSECELAKQVELSKKQRLFSNQQLEALESIQASGQATRGVGVHTSTAVCRTSSQM